MSQKKNNAFIKDINNDSINMHNHINSKNNESPQKAKLLKKIMIKYDISEEEAKKALEKIIITQNKNNMARQHEKNEYEMQNISQNLNKECPTNKKDRYKQDLPNLSNNTFEKKTAQTYATHDKIYPHDKNFKTCDYSEHIKTQNVDNILSDIIPDYKKQISIELQHVDLTFEVDTDKIDTLKELFIKSIKRNKTKKFKINALKDITFKIYQGEKIGVIGYNGAGKSTLLNVISGIYTPDKGFVKTYGTISPLLSLGAGFDQNYSGRKNIFLNGSVLGYEKEYLESKVDDIIEFSELNEFIDIPIKNYSSGMLAKLGFSIAAALNPDILIIDEILGVGDVNFQKKSQDKMKELMDGGTTVILVSHAIPKIREICDKAIWIDNGRVREIGEVNKVCDNYIKDAEKASQEQLANIQLFT